MLYSKKLYSIFIFLFVLLAFNFPLKAQLGLLKEGRFNYLELFEDLDPIQVSLLAEEESVQAGKGFWLGVHLDIAEGWHTYWKNPGDLGMVTKINWTLPEGFEVDEAHWPYPKRFERDNFITFGYEKSALLLFHLKAPETAISGNTFDIKADIEWFACKDECIPGNSSVSLSVLVNENPPKPSLKYKSLFADVRAHLPAKPWDIRAEQHGNKILLHLRPLGHEIPPLDDVYFYPEDSTIIDSHGEQELTLTRVGYILSLPINPRPMAESPDALNGVLVSATGWSAHASSKALSVNVPLAGITKPRHPSVSKQEIPSGTFVKKSDPPPLLTTLLFALLGGFFLNFMPCVFPVISLKVLHLVQSADDTFTSKLKKSLIFTAGIISAFWALAISLLLLRHAGESIGWGFHLQQPIFVALLTALFFLCALNLFGVFEIPSFGVRSEIDKSDWSTFINGVFATLVATPCIGPFLGPALGVAISHSPVVALLIFTLVGMGMAFPFILLTLFPKASSFLPKPGEWMITFKQVLGFFMMATCIWLLWVFEALTDSNALLGLLFSLLFLGSGSWVYGKWCLPSRSLSTRRFGRLSTIALAVIAGLLISWSCQASSPILTTLAQASSTDNADVTSNWEPYSRERLAILLQHKQPVFIAYTAKWCLICQSNKAALYSSAITDRMNQLGITTLTADWTKKDPIITEDLERFGRIGVPLYLLYTGDPQESPMILPQVLTQHTINEYLDVIAN